MKFCCQPVCLRWAGARCANTTSHKWPRYQPLYSPSNSQWAQLRVCGGSVQLQRCGDPGLNHSAPHLHLAGELAGSGNAHDRIIRHYHLYLRDHGGQTSHGYRFAEPSEIDRGRGPKAVHSSFAKNQKPPAPTAKEDRPKPFTCSKGTGWRRHPLCVDFD